MCGKRKSRPECMPVPRPMEESTPRPTHHTTYCSQASASCTSETREPLALRPVYTSSRGTRRKRVGGTMREEWSGHKRHSL